MKNSSCIRTVERNGSNLIIEFVNGKVFEYAGAGSLEMPLQDAQSPGAYFNTQIKGKYQASAF